MNEQLIKLLSTMGDGSFYSGEQLGDLLGVSRARVWKYVQELENFGIQIDAVRGKGYRLNKPVKFLQAEQVSERVKHGGQSIPVHYHLSVDSTNIEALRLLKQGEKAPFVVCSEHQTHGKGRQGKVWQSPLGHNLYHSLVWGTHNGVSALNGLSLVMGLAIVRVLASMGLTSLSLKWPNDILLSGKKVGGLLLEMDGDPYGDCSVVIGVGLNLYMPEETGKVIDQPWADLHQEYGAIDRTQLLADLIQSEIMLLDQFAEEGFAVFREEWMQWDAYLGHKVRISSGPQVYEGIERGINEQGGLLLEMAEEVRAFYGGEMSMRPLDVVD